MNYNMNGDIRAFFSRSDNKSKSKVIEKKTIDISKDVKEIVLKTKEKKANPHKSKVQFIESDDILIKEDKVQSLKKKTKSTKSTLELNELNKQNTTTPLAKVNNTIITRNKKIIEDDDLEIYDDNAHEGQPIQSKIIDEQPKRISKQVIKPVEKKEKLINIEVSDFFSMTKDEVKNKFKEIEAKEINTKEKDNDVQMKDISKDLNEVEKKEEENKMDIDKEDNDSFIDINIDEIAQNIFIQTEDKTNDDNQINQIQDTPQNNNDILKYRTIVRKTIEEKSEPVNYQSPIKQPIISTKSKTNKPFELKSMPISEVKKEESLYQLWSEKYKPKTQSEIIGNTTAVNQLSEWLDHWDDVFLNGIKREVSSISFGKGRKGIVNVNARAAIVSGAPGIGKTSTVRLLATLKNYRTFELNASDQRNKEIINNSVGFLMNNKTLTADKELSTKNLIIMDEVDGMGGNQDKGGISTLINIVKKSKVPIIFICNDIYCQKLKSLINHCYDIRFSKPDKHQVVNRLYTICQKENIKIDQYSIEYLCGGFNCDIRQCLNFLELASKGNINDIKSKAEQFKKDDAVVINSFEGCKKLLNKSESSKLSYAERMDLFYIDYDLIPLLVHENYLSCYGNYNSKADLNKICEVSESLSNGDILDTRIRYRNDWSLLPDKGIQSALFPSVVNGGSLGFPRFPELYSKISKMAKTKRQIKEIKSLMPQTSTKSIKHEVAPLLFSIITNNLVTYGKEGIENIIKFFRKFKFTFAQIKDSLFDLQSESMLSIYTKINNAIKSALTKRMNEQSNLINTVNKRGTKRDKTVIQYQTIKRDIDGNLIEENEQSLNEDIQNNDNEEDDSSSIFEAIPKAKKTQENQKKEKK